MMATYSKPPGSLFQIKEWSAAYYVNLTRRWTYGTLILTQEGIVFAQSRDSFKASNKIREPVMLFVHFEAFVDLKKTSSTLIFPALTVNTKDDCHWFSSLADRETVFNALSHFWKCRLLPETCGKGVGNSSTTVRTKMGKELLSLVQDSEKTLSLAAASLHHQGEKLDVSMATMEDLHNDLDVADRVVSGLESYIGPWSAKSRVPIIDPVVVKRTDIPDVSNFDVLYAKEVGPSVCPYAQGSLWISRKEGVTILGSKQDVVQHFGVYDLSRVRVLNPWELVLTKYRIGQPDLSYHIISTKATNAVEVLEKGTTRKIEYLSSPEQCLVPSPVIAGINTPPTCMQQNSCVELSSGFHGTTQPLSSSKHGPGETVQQQVSKQSPTVSDAEVQNLQSMLGNLKAMAIDIQKEEDHQSEKIDSLLTTVDRANIRVEDTDKRVKKLLRS